MQYIYSFSDDGLGLKTYLNEEIGRLKKVVVNSLEMEEVKEDPMMLESTNKVISIIEEYKTKHVDEEMINQVLRIQKLAQEIESNG